MSPNLPTHYTEDQGRPTRVVRAICGAMIHSRHLATETSDTPTCEKCKQMLDDFDNDGIGF